MGNWADTPIDARSSPKERYDLPAFALLVSGRYQVIHSQVLHHLSVVIVRVPEKNPRCINSRCFELLTIRICYLLQQVLIRQGADGLVCMCERTLQIPDDIVLARQILRALL